MTNARRSARRLGFRAAAVGVVAAAVWAISAVAGAASGDAEAGEVTAKFVRSEWHALYLGGQKVGYTTRSLYRLSDGGHRMKFNTFLVRRRGEGRFGFYRMITADVDERFRPRAVRCKVARGSRRWRVTGEVRRDVLHLERTVDDGPPARHAIPIEEDMTFRCWAVAATVMDGTTAGRVRRWLAVDASLGAVVPDPYLVRVLGPRGMPGVEDGENLLGTAVVSACGLEQVVHLVDDRGRTLRSVWQTTPMVAEATSLSEARRLEAVAEPPDAAEVPGLSYRGFESARLGLSLYIPPEPYAAHVVPRLGALKVLDLTDEAYVVVRPVQGGVDPSEEVAAASGDGGTDAASAPGTAEAAALLSHPAYRRWAGRFEDVTAEPRRVVVPAGAEGAHVLALGGRARLGCTTYHYRNLLLYGGSLTWFVSVMVADRPVRSKPMLSENVARSIRLDPPEGRLPIQTLGLTVRSPLYGFQIRRPNEQWTIPDHLDGPATALEVARVDQAAVAVIRILDRAEEQTLREFVGEQAEAAARKLGVPKPGPSPATLNGLPGYELVYEGQGLLSGARARTRATYVRHRGRVLALVSVVRADAEERVRREVEQLRESLTFLE